jgi:hypothetical protein
VNLFPDFDSTLRDAFKREVELFFTSIIQEDRSVDDLLTADYTSSTSVCQTLVASPASTARSSVESSWGQIRTCAKASSARRTVDHHV